VEIRDLPEARRASKDTCGASGAGGRRSAVGPRGLLLLGLQVRRVGDLHLTAWGCPLLPLDEPETASPPPVAGLEALLVVGGLQAEPSEEREV
jgi:hypothetical protein